MIAVTGASGQLGHFAIQHLLKRVQPSEVVAIVRNPEKDEDLLKLGINVRRGDYDQPTLWGEALKGVTKLLLISSNAVGSRLNQHKVVINAAKESKIEQLAYTSILRADTSSLILAQEHLETERAIQESGVPFTFLRNGWYFENDTQGLPHAIQSGVIRGASEEGKLSAASREDYAEAASVVLTSSGHSNKVYELGGDSSFTMSDLAKEVAKQSGKSIVYKNFSLEEYKNFLLEVGLPEGFAGILANSYVEAGKGGLYTDSKDLSKLIGHPTTSLASAVKKALQI